VGRAIVDVVEDLAAFSELSLRREMSAASVEIREDITIQGFELERHKEKLRDHDARLDDIISQLTNKAEKIELLTQSKSEMGHPCPHQSL